MNLGSLAQRAGDSESARRHYEYVLVRSPEHSGALNNLALLLLEQPGEKAIERAKELLARAIAADPSRADARKNLAMLVFASGNPAEAQRLLRRALELTPEDRLAWEALAEVSRALGGSVGASLALERAAAL